MSIPDIHKTDPKLLSQIMDMDAGAGQSWRDRDLAAMLKHQLATPLEVDVSRSRKSLTSVYTRIATEQGPGRTFGDLLRNPSPPLDALRLVKEFAKISRGNPRRPLPEEIASVLYFTSILLAWSCHRQRISSLGEAQIRDGARWVLAQPWLDESIRAVVRAASRNLQIP